MKIIVQLCNTVTTSWYKTLIKYNFNDRTAYEMVCFLNSIFLRNNHSRFCLIHIDIQTCLPPHPAHTDKHRHKEVYIPHNVPSCQYDCKGNDLYLYWNTIIYVNVCVISCLRTFVYLYLWIYSWLHVCMLVFIPPCILVRLHGCEVDHTGIHLQRNVADFKNYRWKNK